MEHAGALASSPGRRLAQHGGALSLAAAKAFWGMRKARSNCKRINNSACARVSALCRARDSGPAAVRPQASRGSVQAV